jgi:hypothetical protein
MTETVARHDLELRAGSATLARTPSTGHLEAVFDALRVPDTSRMLVFSQRGLQRDLPVVCR